MVTKTPFRPFSSVAVRIRKRPAQTSFCIRQLSLVFVPWYPSQGGDHRFESGTGYQKSAGQSIVFGLFSYLGTPSPPPLDTTVTRICLWVRLKWILRPYLLTAPNSSYHCLMAR